MPWHGGALARSGEPVTVALYARHADMGAVLDTDVGADFCADDCGSLLVTCFGVTLQRNEKGPRCGAPSGMSLCTCELVCRGHQVGQQQGGIRRAEAGHRIPARRGRVARNRGVEMVVAGRDVME